MKLEHSFTVPADLDTVWAAVLDPERVAPCMPGATLAEVDGDSFTGSVKVKLGPISLLYKGSGEFLEKDETSRKVVIKASGKDARGNGTASATVTLTLTGEGSSTTGKVDTDLSITGKPAQFGRGLISEVGGKILDAFATCLASTLAPEQPAAASSPAAPAGSEPADREPEPAPADEPKPEPTPSQKPKLAVVDTEPESEPIDLLAFAGPSVAKRAAPLIAIALAALIAVILRRRH